MNGLASFRRSAPRNGGHALAGTDFAGVELLVCACASPPMLDAVCLRWLQGRETVAGSAGAPPPSEAGKSQSKGKQPVQESSSDQQGSDKKAEADRLKTAGREPQTCLSMFLHDS